MAGAMIHAGVSTMHAAQASASPHTDVARDCGRRPRQWTQATLRHHMSNSNFPRNRRHAAGMHMYIRAGSMPLILPPDLGCPPCAMPRHAMHPPPGDERR